jgi:sorbitol-specific phosphotransferase system component IIBC
MTTAVRKRKRTTTRKVSVVKENAMELVQNLMSVIHSENKQMNEHKKLHDTARKSLYKEMKDAKLAEVEVGQDDGTTLIAMILAPERTTIDVAKLKKLVTDEQFMQIVSATQASINKVVGSSVLNQCSTTSKGTENVVVKVKK